MTNKLILLVQDNEDDEIMTIRSLRDGGFLGEVVERGAERTPDVVLLDIRLPKISGHQVLERIRSDERTRHLPVVMLTASDEQQDLLRSYDLHVNSYVRKPVTLAEFQRVMQSLGMYWTEFNRSPAQY